MKATEAYIKHMEEAQAALERVNEYMTNTVYDTGLSDIDWGDAGTMQEIAHRLEAIADMIESKGEYAK